MCCIVSANEVRRHLTVNWRSLDPRFREDSEQKWARDGEIKSLVDVIAEALRELVEN